MSISKLDVTYNCYSVGDEDKIDGNKFADSVAVTYTVTDPLPATYLDVSMLVLDNNQWTNFYTFNVVLSESCTNTIQYSVNDALNRIGIDRSDEDVVWRVKVEERVDKKIESLYDKIGDKYLRTGFEFPRVYNSSDYDRNLTGEDGATFAYIDTDLSIKFRKNTSYSKIDVQLKLISESGDLTILPRNKKIDFTVGSIPMEARIIDFNNINYSAPDTQIEVEFKFYDSIGHLYKKWNFFVSKVATCPISNNTVLYSEEDTINILDGSEYINIHVPWPTQEKSWKDIRNKYGIRELKFIYSDQETITEEMFKTSEKESPPKETQLIITNNYTECEIKQVDDSVYVNFFDEYGICKYYNFTPNTGFQLFVNDIAVSLPYKCNFGDVIHAVAVTGVSIKERKPFVTSTISLENGIDFKDNELIIQIPRTNSVFTEEELSELSDGTINRYVMLHVETYFDKTYNSAWSGLRVQIETIIVPENTDVQYITHKNLVTINTKGSTLTYVNNLGGNIVIHCSLANGLTRTITCKPQTTAGIRTYVDGVWQYPPFETQDPDALIQVQYAGTIITKDPKNIGEASFINSQAIQWIDDRDTVREFDINHDMVLEGVRLRIPVRFWSNREIKDTSQIEIWLQRYDSYGNPDTADLYSVSPINNLSKEGDKNLYQIDIDTDSIPPITDGSYTKVKNEWIPPAMGWKAFIKIGGRTWESEELRIFKYKVVRPDISAFTANMIRPTRTNEPISIDITANNYNLLLPEYYSQTTISIDFEGRPNISNIQMDLSKLGSTIQEQYISTKRDWVFNVTEHYVTLTDEYGQIQWQSQMFSYSNPRIYLGGNNQSSQLRVGSTFRCYGDNLVYKIRIDSVIDNSQHFTLQTSQSYSNFSPETVRFMINVKANLTVNPDPNQSYRPCVHKVFKYNLESIMVTQAKPTVSYRPNRIGINTNDLDNEDAYVYIGVNPGMTMNALPTLIRIGDDGSYDNGKLQTTTLDIKAHPASGNIMLCDSYTGNAFLMNVRAGRIYWGHNNDKIFTIEYRYTGEKEKNSNNAFIWWETPKYVDEEDITHMFDQKTVINGNIATPSGTTHKPSLENQLVGGGSHAANPGQ